MFVITFDDLQHTINYTFNDVQLLATALTHSSHSNEKNISKETCNERLEYLGDAVLELIISEYIFNEFPHMPEGGMTKMRASVVCEQSLSNAARSIQLGDYLLLGRGEDSTGGRQRNSILADAFEALLGAVFLDGGMDAARAHALNILSKEHFTDDSYTIADDSKTKLQEFIQRNDKTPLEYSIVSESGPDHNKTFVSTVSHHNKVIGTGRGKSKKIAEQMAALEALKTYAKVNVD